MRCLRFLSFLAVFGVLVYPTISTGQNSQIAPRVTTPVNDSSLVTLTGNVSSRARAEFDLGAASPSTQLSHVRLMLSRTSAQEAALNKYLADLQDKSSPNYHKWLTPVQFGKLYGPADSDIAAIVAWLQSRGLRVDGVSSGRTNIAFSGSVAQIQQAFHTSIHSYQVHGEQFFSNNSNPKIPAALAAVVSGVARLNTIQPRPQHVANRLGMYDPATHRLKAAQPVQSGRRPKAELTTGSGTSTDPYQLYIVPGDAATIYDTPNTTLNANFTTGTSVTGSGVTIGVGGDAVIQASTVVSYRNRFLGDSNPPVITNVASSPATSTTDIDEAYIDTELAGGLAPGATIHFYTASTLDIAIEQMLADNSVDIFSLSFGQCELSLTTAENALINGWWQQAATQGIAVTVATGDNGSAGCDDNSTETSATGGLAVSGYASTPFNIAVGGTDLIGLLDQSTFTTFVSDPSANSSTTLYRTAQKYIPESTWNDSLVTNGTLDNNTPFTDTNGQNNINAGSGGSSSCSTNTSTDAATGTCTSGYAKPTWQAGIGVPADALRDIPDISLMSGAGGDNASWLVCTDDVGPNSATPPVNVTANCTDQSDGQFYFFGFGGTSTAAPAFAGILAIVQQNNNKGRLGQAAKQLYDVFNGAGAASVFNDITVGNNSVYCASGSTNCTLNGAGSYFLTGYDTAIGYDLATGLGSVDVNQLIAYWGTGNGDSPVTVTVTPAKTTVDTITSLSVSVSVTDPANLGTPTGNVTISGGGYTSPQPATALDGTGSATFTIPAGKLAAGADTLTVIYNGDAGDTTYSVATGTATVTVTRITSSVTVTPASASIPPSASLVVTGTVSGGGTGKPTGTVTLTGGGYTSAATNLTSGSYSITIPANSLALGTNTLTVNYSGDAIYNTGSGNGTVTVPGFTMSATPLSFTAGASTGNASTVTVTPVGGYTGTITLTAAVTSAPAGAVSAPTFTGSTVTITNGSAQTGTITVATSPIPSYVRAPGSNGIAWFKAAGGTTILGLLFFFLPLGTRRGRKILSLIALVFAAAFTIAGCGSVHTNGGGGQMTTPSVTVSPAKAAIATTDQLSVAVSVSGGTSTATGTVTLTSGSYSSSATTLASGAATIVVPAGKLPVGTQTLTASYSGDSNFNSATGTGSVKVGAPATTAGSYTVTVTGTGGDAAATTAPTTFTITVN